MIDYDVGSVQYLILMGTWHTFKDASRTIITYYLPRYAKWVTIIHKVACISLHLQISLCHSRNSQLSIIENQKSNPASLNLEFEVSILRIIKSTINHKRLKRFTSQQQLSNCYVSSSRRSSSSLGGCWMHLSYLRSQLKSDWIRGF